MVMTRSDPSLNLARLRASGALAEVRASDLALTREEASELLVERGGPVSRARRGRGALRANGGLAGSPLPRVALASRRRESARSGARVRRRSSIRRRLPEPRGPQVARRGVALVPVAYVGPPSLHRRALRQRLRTLRRGVHARGAGAFEPLRRSAWSTRDGSASIRCSPSLPSSSSNRTTPAPRWRSIGGLLCGFSNEGFCRRRSSTLRPHTITSSSPPSPPTTTCRVIRSGGARTLVRWAKMLPDEQLVEHPELAMAAATAVSLVGPRTVERRRFLQLAERARYGGLRAIHAVRRCRHRHGSGVHLRRRSNGERRGSPPCGRDRRAGGRRRAGRVARSPCTGALLQRRPRGRLGGGRARARAPRAPSDGRPPTRSPGRRSPWPTSTAGFFAPLAITWRRRGR